jgi:acyl-homoserine-lactone acylase
VRAYDAAPETNAKLAGPVAALRTWDYKWGSDSIPTSLAVYWAESLARATHSVDQSRLLATSPGQKLASLSVAVDRLAADFGTWRTRWGSINRFQRLNDDIASRFDDASASIPVPFVSGIWGSLAAFYAAPGPNTKRRYGGAGNSFVAVVEFGPRVRAVAVTAGGESGDPASSHFDDEAIRYSMGNLRPVYFYADQLIGHTERTYHPGA